MGLAAVQFLPSKLKTSPHYGKWYLIITESFLSNNGKYEEFVQYWNGYRWATHSPKFYTEADINKMLASRSYSGVTTITYQPLNTNAVNRDEK